MPPKQHKKCIALFEWSLSILAYSCKYLGDVSHSTHRACAPQELPLPRPGSPEWHPMCMVGISHAPQGIKLSSLFFVVHQGIIILPRVLSPGMYELENPQDT